MFSLPNRPRRRDADPSALSESQSTSFVKPHYRHPTNAHEELASAYNCLFTSALSNQESLSPSLGRYGPFSEHTNALHNTSTQENGVSVSGRQTHHTNDSNAPGIEERADTAGPPVMVASQARHLAKPLSGTPDAGPASINFWKSGSTSTVPEPSTILKRSRRPRRDKPRIELAPDQPPTTQGKARERVYVACLPCRSRKIRCDGAKPVCHNCGRRANGSDECNYDPVPKRRGPDKTPGARQRLARESRDRLDGMVAAKRRRRLREDQADDQEIPVVPLFLPANPPIPSADNSSPENIFSSSSVSPTSDHLHSPNEPLPSHVILSRSHKQHIHQQEFLPAEASVAVYADDFDLSTFIPVANMSLPISTQSRIAQFDGDEKEAADEALDIGCQPSSIFRRKTWWDSLLSLYLGPISGHRQALNSAQRDFAAHAVTSDIRFLFRESNYWFSFFHIPTFFTNFYDPIRRENMQPSLALALLAMSTFWQSSEVGLGRNGRDRALLFRDEAQSALDASFNAGWIDESLAQAAWLLALFEVCAHPQHSTGRSRSSMVILDSIIHSLSLTFVDADDPNASVFSPGSVPAVTPRPKKQWSEINSLATQEEFAAFGGLYRTRRRGDLDESPDEEGCSCKSMTLSKCWPEVAQHIPLWASTPAWNSTWSEGEIRKESCRRLCWSSMILAAGHASYTTAHQSDALNLFISDPANYALLFSGESIASSPTIASPLSSKDTIWALHDRSFLLWHACIKTRNDPGILDRDKAHFAVKAWLEADALECALNKHTCDLERASIYQAREYIFNTRMCISYEFQRFIPLVTANVSGLFHRDKAKEWLTRQAHVSQRFMMGLHAVTGNSTNLLARRPFFVFWFMGQISRALSLWECDPTLTIAMDVCKSLLPALDYLTTLWPCGEQRIRYDSLRERLDRACYNAGLDRPPPPNFTLSLSSSIVLV